ncbi:MAG: glycosyltransferase [Candidatus Saccharibacteria bacterium]
MSSSQNKNKPTICIVTCYRQPDYVRAATLRRGLKDSDVFSEVIIIKNSHLNFLRYLEVCTALVKVRLFKNPDAYLITFRGYEILPFVLLIGAGKKIIYDELTNPVEWFVYEHKYLVGPLALLGTLLRISYSAMMKMTTAVIADTRSHALYSSQLMSVEIDKYFTIPVGTDETMFKPIAPTPRQGSRPFRVLYYGSMLPLHGVSYVLEAAVALAHNRDIEFHVVGGKQAVAKLVASSRAQGAHVKYESWVQYQKLPQLLADSDLCLAGPFGDTVQSQFVVTGKTYQFLASGRPAVIGQNQETRQFVDKQNVLSVPQADSAALVGAIKWASRHPKQLRQIADNGRKLYERDFSSRPLSAYLRRLFLGKHIFEVQTRRGDKQQD